MTNYINAIIYQNTVLCNTGILARAYKEDTTVNKIIYFDNKGSKLKGRS